MGEIIDIRDLKRTSEAEKMTKLEFEARIAYLEGYLSEKTKMRSYDLQLEELELDYGPSAHPISGIPGGKKTDGSDRIIRRLSDRKRFEAEYVRHRDAAFREMVAIENVIAELAPKYQKVLRLRYLNDMDIAQIAEEIHYSYRQVQRHHNQGVERLRPPRHKIDRIKRKLMQEHPEWASLEIKSA